jgi:hypothetical protein
MVDPLARRGRTIRESERGGPVCLPCSRNASVGKGSLADSLCSRNARPQKALVGRAQLRVSHVTIFKSMWAGTDR